MFLGVLATQNFDEMFPQFPRPSCFGVKTFYPKRKLKQFAPENEVRFPKRKSDSSFLDSRHFSGGLDVNFLAVGKFRARNQGRNFK